VSIGRPIGQALQLGGSPLDYFRTYESPPPVASFWGQRYELYRMALALEALVKTISEIRPK